jgi:hypothetical protein
MNNTHLKTARVATLSAGLAMLLSLTSVHAADVVVVGSPGAAALTKDQISDAYLGKNQSVTPVDLPESSAVRGDFYQKLTGRDLPQIKALWSRLTFTGKAQPPKEVADATAVKKAVVADPKAIGYIEKSALDGSVKVLLEVN